MSAGVGLMFWGYLKTIAPAPRSVQVAPRVTEQITAERLSTAD
jgi:hypothetical protein